ncbi:unnamed protein product [Prorocentrum cordatum]|uniref:C2 domain-containing protein n=1 Tax=Prorocentrum cordatum TaxID=2364126 RepID=A0ABN9T334_9DINO|nr:unnamed protein product [Polarella glacialis]
MTPRRALARHGRGAWVPPAALRPRGRSGPSIRAARDTCRRRALPDGRAPRLSSAARPLRRRVRSGRLSAQALARMAEEAALEEFNSIGMMVAAAGVAALVLLLLMFLCLRQLRRRHVRRAAKVGLFLDRLEAIQGELLRERLEEGPTFSKDYTVKQDVGTLGRASRLVHNRSDQSGDTSGQGSPRSLSLRSGRSRPRRGNTRDSMSSDPSRLAKEDALDLKENVWRWKVDPGGSLTTTDECTSWAVKVLICLSLDPPARPPDGDRHAPRPGSPAPPSACPPPGRGGHAGTPQDTAAVGGGGMLPSVLPFMSRPSPSPEMLRSDREHCERAVSSTLLRFCRDRMFDPEAVRCCIVADHVRAPGVVRSDTPVLEFGRNDHLIVADIVPILCDAADYCILVIEDPCTLQTIQPKMTRSNSGRLLPKDADSTEYLVRKAPSLADGRLEEWLVGRASSDVAFGPAIYLAGLAALSLKSERQSYVQYGVDDHERDIPLHGIVPYSQLFEKSNAALELDSEVAGLELRGGLLCLWAMNVSHGSFGFVRDAAPLMAELGRRSHRWSCLACKRRAGFSSSMSTDILEYFQSFREREPISAHNQVRRSMNMRSMAWSKSKNLTEVEDMAKRRLGNTSARAQSMHDLQASLTRRAMISRYLRLYLRNKGADDVQLSVASLCDASMRFVVPSSHPMALQLHCVTQDVDYMLDRDARGILEQVQKYMTLEELADRIKGFLVAYLRRMNGSSDKNLAHKEQLAAFELYTAAAEGQGYLVDVVRDFLCNKAEMRGYQKVTKALADPLPESNDEMKEVLSVESNQSPEECTYAPLFVHFVGATQLPRVHMSWQASNTDELRDALPAAYCTLGVEGSDTVLLQTCVATQGVNPEWKERLELQHYPKGGTLVFNVWHHDPDSRDSFLGRALLPYSKFEKQEFVGEIILGNGGSQVRRHSVTSEHLQAGSLVLRVSMTAPSRAPVPRRITAARYLSGASGGGTPTKGGILQTACTASTLSSGDLRSSEKPSKISLKPSQSAAGRDWTLADRLLTVTEVHQKLERVMIELVAEAKEEAEQQGVVGAAQVDQSLHRNRFWDLVEGSTFRTLERQLWNQNGNDHGDLAKSDRADMADKVDREMQSTEGDPFFLDHFEGSTTRAMAQTRVMCDSFWIMHLVMLRLEKTRRLVVLSRHSNLKSRRKAPAVVYTVRLKDGHRLPPPNSSNSFILDDMGMSQGLASGSRGQRQLQGGSAEGSLLEVILVHKKIAAVGQENRSAVKQMISEMPEPSTRYVAPCAWAIQICTPPCGASHCDNCRASLGRWRRSWAPRSTEPLRAPRSCRRQSSGRLPRLAHRTPAWSIGRA